MYNKELKKDTLLMNRILNFVYNNKNICNMENKKLNKFVKYFIPKINEINHDVFYRALIYHLLYAETIATYNNNIHYRINSERNSISRILGSECSASLFPIVNKYDYYCHKYVSQLFCLNSCCNLYS